MAKQTMGQKVVDEMTGEGYKLVGKTSGSFSYRAGSNLMLKLESLGLTKDTAEVRAGARAGMHKSEGYELYIFVKDGTK